MLPLPSPICTLKDRADQQMKRICNVAQSSRRLGCVCSSHLNDLIMETHGWSIRLVLCALKRVGNVLQWNVCCQIHCSRLRSGATDRNDGDQWRRHGGGIKGFIRLKLSWISRRSSLQYLPAVQRHVCIRSELQFSLSDATVALF